MTTRANVNVLAGRLLRDLVQAYPASHQFIIRAAVNRAKSIGTVEARDTLRGFLRELYRESHGGEDPVGKHEFKHWMRTGLGDTLLVESNSINPTPDPISGVDASDAFEAVAEDIT